MSEIKITASEIFNWLDNQDDKNDRIIHKKAWDKFQSIFGCNGINNCILEENAMKTINSYLKNADNIKIDKIKEIMGLDLSNREIQSKTAPEEIKDQKIQEPQNTSATTKEPQKHNISSSNTSTSTDFSNIFSKPDKSNLYRREIAKSIFNDEENVCYKIVPVLLEKLNNGIELSKEEMTILNEFDMMMDTICQSGDDYGVDPRLISTIIRRECRYNGVHCGGDGSIGHMQLTLIAIRDFVGDDGYGKIKVNKYGNELKELLESRGFPTDNTTNKTKLAKDIFKYLENNRNDVDFNIRLGTLLLRYLLKKYKGNVQSAARAYNGHPEHKENYGRDISKRYKIICEASNNSLDAKDLLKVGSEIPLPESTIPLENYTVDEIKRID